MNGAVDMMTRNTAARPEPTPAPVPERRAAVPLMACALATSVLLYLSYFPVGWGFLGWVALVPLLFLVRSDASGKKVFGIAYMGGLVFFLAAVQWMRVADWRMYFTWILLSVYCALYFPVGVLLLRRIDRRTGLPLVLTLPVVWIALEYLRSILMGG